MELSEQNVKKQRPVHLDLQTIRFPAAAIASILHRITGVIMLFAVGILLWLLNASLQSAESFNHLQSLLDSFVMKFILWGILTALGYHLLGGLRHLVMDTGRWEELASGKASAKAVFVLAIVFSVLAGVWVW
ncbi:MULTISPECIES: succinate dehydrogenase cytochrome b556 subunit [Shewanella]|jgi:succinate dehydrogenase / fumarate reductase cytochrome b subunit|uniref:Succinate dehydrogenase cytochrome b556 subunit n=1 Tax=Shewanella fodinae TaxID=552357 RepID=A0A4R2F380_9GAMM|nr:MULTISPECIES: succinate dehydrogenase cytochrome b556 subunit [Shewanella]MDN5370872.1 succinate dehydrogenase / fumarate reductase, cytochrome b subunit [Shewanella sp.]MBO1272253.1 succinate dehydrogenase cytochrome b556 subunit [Shewanella sp. 4t3-1-2LB]MCL2908061.1 succinate dehydrogenase cytochrome b556 subunit [Shewanella fodinae]TCN78097.1 succinate dehydrogenase subunit C [Shewanella fodinae]GGZ13086.1 succinate dehydrogenase, cytochrome b556 subunit [Shewanella fodinae]